MNETNTSYACDVLKAWKQKLGVAILKEETENQRLSSDEDNDTLGLLISLPDVGSPNCRGRSDDEDSVETLLLPKDEDDKCVSTNSQEEGDGIQRKSTKRSPMRYSGDEVPRIKCRNKKITSLSVRDQQDLAETAASQTEQDEMSASGALSLQQDSAPQTPSREAKLSFLNPGVSHSTTLGESYLDVVASNTKVKTPPANVTPTLALSGSSGSGLKDFRKHSSAQSYTSKHPTSSSRYATTKHSSTRDATSKHLSSRNASSKHSSSRDATSKHSRSRDVTPRHSSSKESASKRSSSKEFMSHHDGMKESLKHSRSENASYKHFRSKDSSLKHSSSNSSSKDSSSKHSTHEKSTNSDNSNCIRSQDACNVVSSPLYFVSKSRISKPCPLSKKSHLKVCLKRLVIPEDSTSKPGLTKQMQPIISALTLEKIHQSVFALEKTNASSSVLQIIPSAYTAEETPTCIKESPKSVTSRDGSPMSLAARDVSPMSVPTRDVSPVSESGRDVSPISKPTQHAKLMSESARGVRPISGPAPNMSPIREPARNVRPTSAPARETCLTSTRKVSPTSAHSGEVNPMSVSAKEESIMRESAKEGRRKGVPGLEVRPTCVDTPKENPPTPFHEVHSVVSSPTTRKNTTPNAPTPLMPDFLKTTFNGLVSEEADNQRKRIPKIPRLIKPAEKTNQRGDILHGSVLEELYALNTPETSDLVPINCPPKTLHLKIPTQNQPTADDAAERETCEKDTTLSHPTEEKPNRSALTVKQVAVEHTSNYPHIKESKHIDPSASAAVSVVSAAHSINPLTLKNTAAVSPTPSKPIKFTIKSTLKNALQAVLSKPVKITFKSTPNNASQQPIPKTEELGDLTCEAVPKPQSPNPNSSKSMHGDSGFPSPRPASLKTMEKVKSEGFKSQGNNDRMNRRQRRRIRHYFDNTRQCDFLRGNGRPRKPNTPRCNSVSGNFPAEARDNKPFNYSSGFKDRPRSPDILPSLFDGDISALTRKRYERERSYPPSSKTLYGIENARWEWERPQFPLFDDDFPRETWEWRVNCRNRENDVFRRESLLESNIFQDSRSDWPDILRCKRCLKFKIDVVLFPCAHAALCLFCSDGLQICPFCERPVVEARRIFLPTR